MLGNSAVIESNVAYLRVAAVDKNLQAEIQSEEQAVTASNNIVGMVLDLRFAGGSDEDSAKAVESLLSQDKRPLAILVNDQTLGAARNWPRICAPATPV